MSAVGINHVNKPDHLSRIQWSFQIDFFLYLKAHFGMHVLTETIINKYHHMIMWFAQTFF